MPRVKPQVVRPLLRDASVRELLAAHSRVQLPDDADFDIFDRIQEDATLALLADRQAARGRKDPGEDAFWR